MADDRKARLEKVRKRLAKRGGSRQVDPTEWRPPKVSPGQKDSFKFVVLPPLQKDEKCATGAAKTDMLELYDYRAGTHWIENRPHECPRLHDNDDCPYCQLGFDLIGETEDKEQRRQLARTYLPREVRAVNIYFPPYKATPQELRGKVFWFAVSQKTIYSLFDECLNRDEEAAKGDTPEEDQAWGFFYESDESYVFNAIIKHKNGYNDYSESKFLASTRGPIIKGDGGELDEEKMATILSQRHDLGSKFSVRDAKKLQGLADKVMKPEDESGFDEEEDELVDAPATTKSSKKKSDDDELVDEPKAEKPKAKEEAKEENLDKEVDALLDEIRSE